MKVKLDFVTNSSSTSYMVADFSKDKGPLKVIIEYDVEKEGDVKIESIEDLKKLSRFEYDFRDGRTIDDMDEEDRKLFDKFVEVLNRGGVLYEISANSDSYNPVCQALYETGITKSDFNRQEDEMEIVW